MSDLKKAAQQALEALEDYERHTGFRSTATDALRAALEQQEQEPRWLTKELMADYLDMIAEAIENNRSEMLRHKAHWMRNRGEV
jgi:hypothetical protein